MASSIKILPPTLANKIAAGEVVQRPASAVKELLENAIDAGATDLTVIIRDGGRSLIQVIDNGSGMNSEDAIVAFDRHATSKIATYEDLESIQTLGFRGEALASIAAVSQVELQTRQHAHEIGTRVRIEGGILKESGDVATPAGTSIAVKNLFYNTPGRRNFLKSTNTEFKHIFDAVQRISIAHCEISLRFISDHETVLDLQPATLFDRVTDVFGKRLSQGLFEFEEDSEVFHLKGLLGKPEFARKTRLEQFLFLNKRFVINRNIHHAVFQAYEHLIEKGSFPFFILFLSINPRKVDVNVHPSKMEVKFDDDGAIYRFVISTIRKALSAHDLVPMVGMREESSLQQNFGLKYQVDVLPSRQRVIDWKELVKLPLTFPASTPVFGDDGVPREEPGQPRSQVGLPVLDVQSTIPLWQIHNKYVLVPTEDGVMLVDQHAAHERILYERAVKRFNQPNSSSQQLLFPHSVEMTVGDVAMVRQILPELTSLGFSLKIFGSTTVIVDGVPVDVKAGKESSILSEVIDLFKEDEQGVRLQPRERLAKVYSCKAAIRAGDPLGNAEMHSLLDQLFGTEIPYVCPHGRPVIVRLSLAELDRRFGRTPVT